MISNLLESISTFTILPLKKQTPPPNGSNDASQRHKAQILAFAPLSGLIYGFAASGLVWWLHAEAPILVIWLVPVIWFFLSGAQPFSSLCRVGGAMFAKSRSSAADLLSRDGFTGLGMAVGLLLLTGEFFAMIQGSSITRSQLLTVVLLVPVISRFTAVLFALTSWGRQDQHYEGSKLAAYAIAGVITAAAASVSLEIALLIFFVSLLSSTVLSVVIYSRAGSIPLSSLGALILINEIVAIWVGILYQL